MLLKLFAVVTLASAVFALPPNPATPDLTPWTNLGISLEDAATFFEDGTSPLEGHQLIENEKALFSGTPAHKVTGAVSAAMAMGLGTADTNSGTDPKVVVTIGWRRQHVGITWKRDDANVYDLAGNFWYAINKLCSGHDPDCRYGEKEKLKDIYWNVGKGAYVDVSVESYYLPPSVKWLIIRTVWATFKETTECDSSRYQLRGFGKKHEACREFANSADQIDVRIENFRGSDIRIGQYEQPHLRVKLQFNGVTDEGRFDCVGTQSVIWDKVGSRVLPKFKQAFEDQPVNFDVVCVSDRVHGECKDGDKGHQVICNGDKRWKNECTWHAKCDTPDNCDRTLDF